MTDPEDVGMFAGRFTIFPDTGITQLHCYKCGQAWDVGYHPSLDVLIERAWAHIATCPRRGEVRS